jgi:membrane protease YdiL (CAAX protease family)
MPGRRRARGSAPATRPAPLGDAVGLLVAVWTALALGGALGGTLGRDAALLGSFALAAGLCAVDAGARAAPRRAPGRARRRPSPRARAAPCTSIRSLCRPRPGTVGRLLGLAVAGWGMTPGIAIVCTALGDALGLSAEPLRTTPPSPPERIATLLLAPAFEEHLYRGRLLPALSSRHGSVPACLVSSVCFALPHIEPRAVLCAALAGLVLGARWHRTRRTSDCVAVHVGMNAAALAAAGTHEGAATAAAVAGSLVVTGLALAWLLGGFPCGLAWRGRWRAAPRPRRRRRAGRGGTRP